jgi:FkbM family methyltransferase
MIKKFLKKLSNFFGYKLIEKNLIKNNQTLYKNSTLNIKLILNNIFKQNKIENLIQIGANDGVAFDELNFFIKEYKVKSILVEPIKENYTKLKTNYKKFDFVKLENSAISDDNVINYIYKVDPKFYKYYGNHIPAISSFDNKHLIKHGVKNSHIKKEKVNSLTINELLKKYNMTNLDLFFVDAEGYDGNIVYDFLEKTNLRPIIIFEYIHINNQIFKDLIKKLLTKEYFYFCIAECIFAFPEEKKIEISF